ncbi:LuxR C-terminal-related transcriptional regulator [Streptomyces sp. NBC_00996]|uniref:helix-turn-helix transcriptional regulator n=1 Tax=Streptomyces sp. NBC_00996 TaxID=2903710 RepID=UPI0038676B6E|nr:helix-turn-helix transcriptional regulator [Streptomyces sp. NBC_00996]
MTARPGTVPARFTPAHLRILAKLATGASSASAALDLDITTGTLGTQVQAMGRRAGVSGRAPLLHTAYRTQQLRRPERAVFDGVLDDIELQMVQLVASGASVQEIADACRISRDTAKVRLKRLRDRAGAENDVHLVAQGWRYGWIDESLTVKPAGFLGAVPVRG